MKINKVNLIALGLAAVTFTSFPQLTVFAQGHPGQTLSQELPAPSPRFKYIIQATLILKASSSGTSFNLFVNAIDSVNRICGTATLYKKNSYGNYAYVDSVRIDKNAHSIDVIEKLNDDGAGDYKLCFSGTVSAGGGSEPLSLEHTASY